MAYSEQFQPRKDAVCCFRPVSPQGLRVCWEVTSKCNLLCHHCFVSPPTRSEPAIGRMLEVVKEMASSGVCRVLLSGGEPLMSPSLGILCRSLSDQHILTDINTNGTLADGNRLRGLADAGARELTISLDGSSRGVYERCRPGAKFEVVIDNIRTAIEIGFSVDLTFVPTALNVHDFRNVALLAELLGAANLTVAGLIVTGRAHDNRNLLSLQPSQIRELRDDIAEMRNELDIPIWSNHLTAANPSEECVAAKTIVGIDASGYMHPCPLSPLPQTPANDLTQRSFQSILKSESFQSANLKAKCAEGQPTPARPNGGYG